ncbi:MAG: hypothetical protein FWD32_00070 [Firmicutes bacterium]|nr:hypothetical protein [Bacillota bacterium]
MDKQEFKTIYLASGYAKLKEFGVIYNDLIIPRENRQCMLEVDLSDYDILIATPPCNFYSYARGAKLPSKYALETAHLLLEIIIKFHGTGKPFIVENVTNRTALDFIWVMAAELGLYRFKHARHTYTTNVRFDISGVPKEFDFCKGGYFVNPFGNRQGGNQVSAILDLFVKAAKSKLARKAWQHCKAAEPVKDAQTLKAARHELQKRLDFLKGSEL